MVDCGGERRAILWGCCVPGFHRPPRYKAPAVARLNDARRAMTGGETSNPYDQVLGRDADVLLSQIQIMTSASPGEGKTTTAAA